MVQGPDFEFFTVVNQKSSHGSQSYFMSWTCL